jgi:ParB-like chromosome segregation protein Spo0J
MKHYLSPRSLEISSINFTDFSYSITPNGEVPSDDSLLESVSEFGILHPPVVKKVEQDLHVIVTGRKRIAAFRKVFSREKTCTCLVLPDQIPEIDIFSIKLEERLNRRELTPIERAIFLQKISSLVDIITITEEFLPRVNLPPDPFRYKQSMMLLDLEKPLINAIHQGIIKEETAKMLLSQSADDRLALTEIMLSLQPSASYQKKMVNICEELTGRENQTIAEILGDGEIKEIINHKNANPPQKMKNLMHYLSRKQMPRSSQAEDEFKRFSASMDLPENVTVDHTPYFEDDSVTLSINFPNRESVQKSLKKIKDAIRKSDN